ncbi:hypothetical protein BC833DRAFT_606593 [Globomyces pollinis-pini]|nr:hypothetical protein BC833DRAFT_606593 [Globomyces pollinis-pini]
MDLEKEGQMEELKDQEIIQDTEQEIPQDKSQDQHMEGDEDLELPDSQTITTPPSSDHLISTDPSTSNPPSSKDPISCYCQSTIQSPTLPQFQCTSCFKLFHQQCIPLLKLWDYKPLLGDHFYHYTCLNCGNGTDSIKRSLISLPDVLYIALFNLSHTKEPPTIIDNVPYFSIKSDIVPFVEKHWDQIWSRHKSGVWKNHIVTSLLSAGMFMCSVKMGDDVGSGYWALKKLVIPPIKKTRPSSSMITKSGILLDFEDKVQRKRRKMDDDGHESTPVTQINYQVEEPLPKKPKKKIIKSDEMLGDEDQPKKKKPVFKLVETVDPQTAIRLYPDVDNPLNFEVQISSLTTHTAPQVQLSPNCLVLSNEKGYRLAKSTHGIWEHSWCFEVSLLTDTGHARIGFSQISGDLQAPCGYDQFSYSFRDTGSLFHQSKGHNVAGYEHGYKKGDILTCCISLPKSKGKDYDVIDPVLLYRLFDEEDIENSYVQIKSNPLVTLPNSKIEYYVNGQPLGTAFTDLLQGKYHAAISLYNGAQVELNFGPKLKYPIEGYQALCFAKTLPRWSDLLEEYCLWMDDCLKKDKRKASRNDKKKMKEDMASKTVTVSNDTKTTKEVPNGTKDAEPVVTANSFSSVNDQDQILCPIPARKLNSQQPKDNSDWVFVQFGEKTNSIVKETPILPVSTQPETGQLPSASQHQQIIMQSQSPQLSALVANLPKTHGSTDRNFTNLPSQQQALIHRNSLSNLKSVHSSISSHVNQLSGHSNTISSQSSQFSNQSNPTVSQANQMLLERSRTPPSIPTPKPLILARSNTPPTLSSASYFGQPIPSMSGQLRPLPSYQGQQFTHNRSISASNMFSNTNMNYFTNESRSANINTNLHQFNPSNRNWNSNGNQLPMIMKPNRFNNTNINPQMSIHANRLSNMEIQNSNTIINSSSPNNIHSMNTDRNSFGSNQYASMTYSNLNNNSNPSFSIQNGMELNPNSDQFSTQYSGQIQNQNYQYGTSFVNDDMNQSSGNPNHAMGLNQIPNFQSMTSNVKSDMMNTNANQSGMPNRQQT